MQAKEKIPCTTNFASARAICPTVPGPLSAFGRRRQNQLTANYANLGPLQVYVWGGRGNYDS